jgi:ApbE superfamily uncharacterized protein (UPF0280 family)
LRGERRLIGILAQNRRQEMPLIFLQEVDDVDDICTTADMDFATSISFAVRK